MTRTKPASCTGCAIAGHGTDFSAIEGTSANGVLIVAEASGEQEARDQLPLRPYAPSGSLLERVFRRMGLSRESFSITNVLRCRPRNNWLDGAPFEHSAIAACRPNLESAIAARRPRAILALGGIATRELTGLAGDALGVGHLAGYVLPGPNDIPVIPNFHPAFLRRGKASYQGIFARILQRSINVAAGRDTSYLWNIDPEESCAKLGYQTRPRVEHVVAYADYVLGHPHLPLSYDLETSESSSLDEDARDGFADTHIRLVQFAIEGAGAIAIPWEPEFRPLIQRILHSANAKCGHNVWLFDNKVLRAAGEREGMDLAPRGIVHDTLAMFHHWQPDLPAHLQAAASFVSFPFPWKHLAGTNLPFYGCCDVDATLRLHTVLDATLRRDGIYGDETGGYFGQVLRVRPILAAMEDRGMPIDDTARLKLAAEFEIAQRELGAEITTLAPVACGRVHPKGGYKGVPPEVKAWLADTAPPTQLAKRFRDSGDDGESYHYEQRVFPRACLDAASNPISLNVSAWCRVYEFNPNSRPQVIAYMTAKGHPIPKDKHRENDDGENPQTTNEKELRRLAGKVGDPFYLKIIEYRGLTKLRGTYVDGFQPGRDGCVHTTFTFDTAIAQLSSRNPNIQNFPKLKPTKKLADAMRGMVAAKPGNVLTEWDYKSCHVLTLGFLAQDANWMRLARLDMHSFIAGHLMDLWDCARIIHESDAELLARFKWLKSDPTRKRVRDDQAKHGILGIGNGLKAKGLYERYMESFPPRTCPRCAGERVVPGARGKKHCPECKGTGSQPGMRIAERVLEIAELIGPRVFKWQGEIQRLAHEQQFLRTEFGHMRRFYEVFRWDPRRMAMGHGDQAEEAIAYWLSNVAHAHMRETMKSIDAAGFAERYGMFNQIHDALKFHFDESLLDEHVRDIYPIMVAPSKVLRNAAAPGGLVIECEASMGRDWAHMTELSLPKHG